MILKSHFLRPAIASLCLAVMLFAKELVIPQEAQSQQFTPPTQISLQMNRLDIEGRIDPSLPDTRCYTVVANRTGYGCTYFDGVLGGSPVKAYPFTSDTIPINIESDIRSISGEDVELGYLYNVTPQEIAIQIASQGNKPLSSVMAQAIASRTFAYYHIDLGSTINNSIDFQVYIPYLYHSRTSVQKQRVNEALTEIFYMTADGSTAPIRAHFGADNGPNTTYGGETYLQSVYDPINDAYGCLDPNGGHYPNSHPSCGTGNGGMSSKGASRWGFGHTSSRGPVASGDPQYPHDNQGNGDPWSVKWDEPFQILTHYYTDIHLRDGGGNIVTPEYRWNPLHVSSAFPPSIMNPSSIYQMGFHIQNTGTLAWDATVNPYRPAYQWQTLAGTLISEGSGEVLLSPYIPPGVHNIQAFVDVVTPSTPGIYRLVVDMQVQIGGNYQYFRNREAGKPWYPLEYICEVGGSGSCSSPEEFFGEPIYLPIIMKNAS